MREEGPKGGQGERLIKFIPGKGNQIKKTLGKPDFPNQGGNNGRKRVLGKRKACLPRRKKTRVPPTS